MKDLTPKHLRCGGSHSSCPAVHELPDGALLIVGKVPSIRDMGDVKVGPGELAIVISAEYFPGLKTSEK